LTARCAKAFEWDYVAGMSNKSGGADNYAAGRGWAGHKVIERIVAGELANKSLMDLAAEVWVQYVRNHLPDKEIEVEDKLFAQWFQDIAQLNGYIQTRVDLSRASSEQPFVIPELSDIISGIPKGYSYAGRIDLAEWNPDTHKVRIFDYKFRDRSKTADNKKSVQPVSYGLAAAFYGYHAEFTFLEVVRGNVIDQRINLDPSRFTFFEERIRDAIELIESGFYPMNTGSWWCSSRWCRHWSYCRGRYEREE
jgi:hypothetical protein